MAIDVVGSNMPADNGVGQNGFRGASNDLPGMQTQNDLLPQVDYAKALRETVGGADGESAACGRSGKSPYTHGQKSANMQGPQTRTLTGTNVPVAYGMKAR